MLYILRLSSRGVEWPVTLICYYEILRNGFTKYIHEVHVDICHNQLKLASLLVTSNKTDDLTNCENQTTDNFHWISKLRIRNAVLLMVLSRTCIYTELNQSIPHISNSSAASTLLAYNYGKERQQQMLGFIWFAFDFRIYCHASVCQCTYDAGLLALPYRTVVTSLVC